MAQESICPLSGSADLGRVLLILWLTYMYELSWSVV